ncbi:MAG: hypothetical protein WC695_03575 [Candidatus Omnitrophota bacterium]
MDKKIGILVGIAIVVFLAAITAINIAIKQFESAPMVAQQQILIKKQAVAENKIVPVQKEQKRLEESRPEIEAPLPPGEQLLQ